MIILICCLCAFGCFCIVQYYRKELEKLKEQVINDVDLVDFDGITDKERSKRLESCEVPKESEDSEVGIERKQTARESQKFYTDK